MGRGVTEGASEAFELFLDTICNTFGGVLFIAILVCVMLQMTPSGGRSSTPGIDPLTVARQQTQLKALLAGIADLQKVQAAQAGQLKSVLGDLGDEGLLVEYAELAKKEQEELAALLENTSRPAKLKSELINLQSLLQRLRAENAALAKRLDKARARVGEQLSLPEAKATTKAQLVLMVSQGRVISASRYDAGAHAAVLDDSQVIVDAASKTVVPRPGQGTRVEAGSVFANEFRKQLVRYDNNVHYFAIAVWPDSWTEGVIVRDLLIGSKFGYNLLLMKENEPIFIGKSAGQEQ